MGVPSPNPPFTQDPSGGFREAMRRLAASVTIITARDEEGRPHGMVASAVIPVSMEPASMLVAVNRSASLHPVLVRTRRFCVNILGCQQEDLLAPFSQSALREHRFRSADWHGATGAEHRVLPWLRTASAVIHCDVDWTADYGTHTLFVGLVQAVQCPEAAHETYPLVWLAGRKASITTAA
ncbi:flavin reductase [Alcaligenaceae bacterium]|nr:flavin reductase [Alcaligenaceae bacterium]